MISKIIPCNSTKISPDIIAFLLNPKGAIIKEAKWKLKMYLNIKAFSIYFTWGSSIIWVELGTQQFKCMSIIIPYHMLKRKIYDLNRQNSSLPMSDLYIKIVKKIAWTQKSSQTDAPTALTYPAKHISNLRSVNISRLGIRHNR